MKALIVLLALCGTAAAQTGSGSGALVQVPLEAGTPEVSAAASPAVVRLGATFTLFVTVTFDPGVEVNLREPVDLGPAFEVRRRDSVDRAGVGTKRVRDYQLEVIAWEVGDLQLPPIAVTFTLGGHAGQTATNAVPIRVDSVLGAVVDDPHMRGDAPPALLTARDWFWAYVSAAAAIGITALVALLVWMRRRAHTVQLTGGRTLPSRKLDTPGQRALARLLEIERSGVLDGTAPTRKAGYAAMVDVIRDYIGARYRVVTRDLTTSELLRALAQTPAAERTQIEAWLERCDVVKYGGLRTTSAEARAVLGDARAVVIATTNTVPPDMPGARVREAS
jgi:hypothetical protein